MTTLEKRTFTNYVIALMRAEIELEISIRDYSNSLTEYDTDIIAVECIEKASKRLNKTLTEKEINHFKERAFKIAEYMYDDLCM